MRQFPLLLVTVSALTSAVGTEKTEPVPIYDEPQHHLLLENATARVLDVQIPAGYVSLFHIHENDIFYATMDGSEVVAEMADGRIYRGRRESGYLENVLSYRADPVVHRVTNEGTSLFRIIAVENLTPANNDEPLEAGRSTTFGTPALENARFRAYRTVLEPGATVDEHHHLFPSLLLQMTEGNTVIRSGKSQQSAGLSRGAWIWHEPGTEHSYINMGSVATTLVEIEIRSQRIGENMKFTVSGFLPTTSGTVYAAWPNNNANAAAIGTPANVDTMVGDEFTAHNGYITEKILELESGKRIVQSWRTANLEDSDSTSRLEVAFEPVEKGCQVTFYPPELPPHGTLHATDSVDNCLHPSAPYFAN